MSEIFRNPANDRVARDGGQRTGDYEAFLRSKEVKAPRRGMSAVPALSGHLRPYQQDCVRFMLEVGGAGLFLDTGLGKTRCELEWAVHTAAASNGRTLLLAPLAVAWQIDEEGRRLGYPTRVIRHQDEVREGINICNYDRLDHLDPMSFGSIGLDESSILKSFNGKTTRRLIDSFANHQWHLAATATPAPNDHMEIGQHAEFLRVMASNEMLMRWFITDQSEMGRYRLKGHAEFAFWDWMASWSRMASMPSDLGDSDEGFVLPPLEVERHRLAGGAMPMKPGALFGTDAISATTLHEVKRRTAADRARKAADLAGSDQESWVLWVDTDYEADAVRAALPGAIEVRGSMKAEEKEASLRRFADGSARKLITKPSICGFGLNWQHCHNTAFVGRSFSYEAWYQAIRRFWRFGQLHPVKAHLIVAEGEDAIGRVIDRKADDHLRMKAAMAAAMRRNMAASAIVKQPYNPTHEGRLPRWFAA